MRVAEVRVGSLIPVALFVLMVACGHSSQPPLGADPLPATRRPVRSAAQCVEVLRAFSADSTFGRRLGPNLLRLVVPTHAGDIPRNGRATAHIRVDTSGRADSVVVTGTTNKRFIATVRSLVAQAVFRPATVNDCAIVGWTSQIYAGANFAPRP